MSDSGPHRFTSLIGPVLIIAGLGIIISPGLLDPLLRGLFPAAE